MSSPAPSPRRPRARLPARATVAALLASLAALVGPGGLARPEAGAAQPDETPTLDFVAGNYVDYAPNGMPDFSTCRAEWSRPGADPEAPGQWTHAGPVALADLLWWLDSRAETNGTAPPYPADGHALVTAYPRFGPRLDDHAQENLLPFVTDLATRLDTDGRRTRGAQRGTRWADLLEGLEGYLAARSLSSDYVLDSREAPDGAWLAARRASGAGVLLLLGVWEQRGESWARIGGHYAALAGSDAEGAWLALADPLADRAAEGGEGRRLPEAADLHSCRNNPRAHDDAAVVSHDAFALFPPPSHPAGAQALAGYFHPGNFHEGAAFAGQNDAPSLGHEAAGWERGVLVMAVDAALALRPAGAAPPTTAPTAVPSASPTETPRPTPPPTVATTAVPTAVPTAAPTLTPSPEATAPPEATPGALPTLGAGIEGRALLWLPLAWRGP